MAKGFEGGCLCGAVRYEVSVPAGLTGNCYCYDCRRSSGSGHCTHIVVPSAAYRVAGRLSAYDRPADSGNIVSRKFCPTCGAPVHSTNSAMPDLVFVRASSLDDPEPVMPQVNVYVSRAPSWDRPDPALPGFAEMPESGLDAVVLEHDKG
jgi:hypothetical protein